MISLFEDIWKLAQSNPFEQALVFSDKQLSRSQFVYLANAFAHLLNDAKIPGTVAINAPFQLHAVITAAVLQLGLPSMKWGEDVTSAEIASFIVTTEKLNTKTDQMLITDELLTSLSQSQPAPLDKGFESLDSTCRIILTSGTTSAPKAIEIPVKRAILEARDRNEKITSRGNELCQMDVGSLVSFTGIVACLRFGQTLFIDQSQEPNIDFLKSNQIAVYRSTPEKLNQLANWPEALPESLRWVDSLGGYLPVEVSRNLESKRGLIVTIRYGTTEAGAVCARVGHHEDWQNQGKPVEDGLVTIVDQDGKQLPASQPGLIRINKRKRFITATEEQYFYPGDEGYFDSEGNLIVLGRTDDFISLPGVRINLAEIENQLKTKFPEVELAAVFDSEVSELVFAIEEQFELSVPIIEKYIQQNFSDLLHKLQLVPSLPKNSMDKINREQLLAELNARGSV